MLDDFLESDIAATAHLRQAGDPRQYGKALALNLRVLLHFPRHVGPLDRSGSYPQQHVPDLWQFIQAGFAQEATGA